MAQSLTFWHVVPEVKLPTVTGRKGDTNRATARPRCRVGRKHEVEPTYVANSEPAIWHREAGRADSSERDPVSGEAPGVKSDEMWGGDAPYPGKPSCSGVEAATEAPENRPAEETPRRGGSRGWQIYG